MTITLTAAVNSKVKYVLTLMSCSLLFLLLALVSATSAGAVIITLQLHVNRLYTTNLIFLLISLT